MVNNFTLYKILLFFYCRCLLYKNFGCYGNFKFPQTYNGKHLLLFHIRCVDESFLEMLLDGHTFLSKLLNLIACHGNQKANFAQNIKPEDDWSCITHLIA